MTSPVPHKVADPAAKIAQRVTQGVAQRVPDAPEELSLVH